jgi:hypothetical protein
VSKWSSCGNSHEISISLSTPSPSRQYGSLDSDSSTTAGSSTSACNRVSQSLVTPAGTSPVNPFHKDAGKMPCSVSFCVIIRTIPQNVVFA